MNLQTIQEAKEEICDIGERMYNREMCAKNDGNISVKVDENLFVVSPTRVSKGYMTPEMMCVCDIDGKEIEPNKLGYKVTSEFKLHAAVFKLRDDVNAVVHAHPLYATAFASCNKAFKPEYNVDGIVGVGEAPVITFGVPGTLDIIGNLAEYTPYHNAVLMQHHGALAWGSDLLTAYYQMEGLEFAAKMDTIVKKIDPEAKMSDENLGKMYDLIKKIFPDGHHIAFKK